MLSYIGLLFAWMPLPLQIVCGGVVFIFTLTVVFHIIAFILDLIPFL